MKRTRTVLAAPTLVLATALALSACGGSGSDAGPGSESADDGKDRPKASAAPEKTADAAADLDRVVLSKTEVKGFTVRKPTTKYVFATAQDQVKLDKPVCAPISYATNQLPLGSPNAHLTRVAAGGEGPGAFTYVTLATYAGGEAKAALAGLSKAVGSCGDGFTATSGKTASPHSSVTAEPAPSPKGADESVAFRTTIKHQGVTHTLRAQTVRYGDTVAVYYAVDAMAFTQARSGDAKLAAAVMDAQNAKLS
ncbi:hypothetical protein JQK87_16300 [Streptomyces sp. G44]|uniref:hypothetical protein n=1 Tax=Streptomyces sp. G44 TaxID=2807632 RepID=UPI00195FB274|nr:hypothetical protein [Streptomyces sp. G44]MBM7169950.1 hypothetical protein [Streptomyces sp. G44]